MFFINLNNTLIFLWWKIKLSKWEILIKTSQYIYVILRWTSWLEDIYTVYNLMTRCQILVRFKCLVLLAELSFVFTTCAQNLTGLSTWVMKTGSWEMNNKLISFFNSLKQNHLGFFLPHSKKHHSPITL